MLRRGEIVKGFLSMEFSPLSACNSLFGIMGLVHVQQGENNQHFIFSLHNLLVMLSFWKYNKYIISYLNFALLNRHISNYLETWNIQQCTKQYKTNTNLFILHFIPSNRGFYTHMRAYITQSMYKLKWLEIAEIIVTNEDY